MSNQPPERFRQNLGELIVSLRGDEVVFYDPEQGKERSLTASEACRLFSWLYSHKSSLYEIVRGNELKNNGT